MLLQCSVDRSLLKHFGAASLFFFCYSYLLAFFAVCISAGSPGTLLPPVDQYICMAQKYKRAYPCLNTVREANKTESPYM